MADYGLGPKGFVPMQQPEVLSDLQAQVQLQLGNVDLSAQSVFGQLLGIFSASSAQLWQAAAALYGSSFPEGASGAAVDNILALNNMRRLGASPTVTNPTPVSQANGVILYGLRLLGAPGTVVPQGTLFSNGAATPSVFSLDANATIGGANNARQTVYFGGVPTTGSYALTLSTPAGAQATTQQIPYSAQARVTTLKWTAPPNAGFTLNLGGSNTTTSLAANATAAQVQAAVSALTGFADVQVTGTVANGLNIIWPAGYVPLVTGGGSGSPDQIGHATSAFVHALRSGDTQPFTDVLLTDVPQAVTLDFGAFAPQQGCPSSAATPIPRIQAPSPALFRNGDFVNVTPQIVVVGNASQAIASATATTTGASSVLAGQLSTIATPISGLTGVTNDLDCLTGRSAESDVDAIARFRAQLGATASGSLGSIIKRVKQIDGVTQVVGFQNTSNAAGQVVQFTSAPTTGQFSLVVGGQTTPMFAYNASPAVVQAAVRNLTGFGSAQVTAYGANGYQFDFTGSRGNQAIPLIGVAQNTTQVALTAYFARPPHSVEIVVEGGSDADVVDAILNSIPAGVSTFSNPSLRTTATLTQGSQNIVVASTVGVLIGQTVEGPGIPLGAMVAGISGSTVSLTAAPTASSTQTAVSFAYAPLVKDAAGNTLSIGYSRPQSVLVYVNLSLTTDLYITPGDASSGINSGSVWDPRQVGGIQDELTELINAVSIGGVVSARGTNGLVGSFRQVPGIVDYSLQFGITPNPTNVNDLQMQSNQAPTAQSYSIQIGYK